MSGMGVVVSGGVTEECEMGYFVCIIGDWKGFSFPRIRIMVIVSVDSGGWV